MANVPSTVLLDINVWLDNYLPGRPSSPDSRALIDWLGRQDAAILFPITAPGTVFYVIQQALKQAARLDGAELRQEDAEAIRAAAWACVENMAELGTPVGADGSDLWLACKLRPAHADLEDNLVLAAAERARADYLVTGDAALLGKPTVPTMTPGDFVQLVCR